jgi:hypothetical protein
LSQSDIWQIEILIGAQIAKPVPTYAPTVHRSANPIRGLHQTIADDSADQQLAN